MHRGYIKLWRKVVDWEWFTDVNTTYIFIYLLLHARHKPGRWRGIDLDVGDIIQTVSFISEVTGLSVRQIRTAIEHLVSTGEVTVRKHGYKRIIKLNNYQQHMSSETTNDTSIVTAETLERHKSDTGSTTNKKVKNEKNEKNTTVVNKKMLTWLTQQGKGIKYAEWMYREYGEEAVNKAWDKALKGRTVKKPADLVELCKTLSN